VKHEPPIRFYAADIAQQPRVNYRLEVSTPDGTGKVSVTSPEVPGLLIYGNPAEALADVPAAVALCRALNAAQKTGQPS
jgi:hypothetical protein